MCPAGESDRSWYNLHFVQAVNCQHFCILLFFLAAPMLRMCLMRQPGAMERTAASAEPWNLTWAGTIYQSPALVSFLISFFQAQVMWAGAQGTRTAGIVLLCKKVKITQMPNSQPCQWRWCSRGGEKADASGPVRQPSSWGAVESHTKVKWL